MTQHQARTELLRNEPVAPDIFRLTLTAPEIAGAARPGQFVMVRVSDGLDPLLRRPFSIHQANSDGTIQLLYKRLGKGTTLLAGLRPGASIDVVGPLGRGFAVAEDEAVCLLGGGMGIAPLYFLARELLRTSTPPRLVALLGARNRAELAPLLSDFEALGVETYSATDDGSLGHHGYVAELMEKKLAVGAAWAIRACGPHPMLKGVAAICREKNWPCQVSLETMMACGISACLGCAIPRAGLSGPYLHVCKDGPVFDAQEVAWP
ncbi:MAG: dihydroorotate dehydrogenase electron transfer subunit [Thermodesulfobacteriota bacterium]